MHCQSNVRFYLGWITICLWIGVPATAAEWHVDDDRRERPDADFIAIQAAINQAADDDRIVVHPGLYNEALRLDGKNVQLRSVRPTDPAIVQATVIHAGRLGPVIRMRGTETTRTMIEGFTLTGGRAEIGGGISSGVSVSSRAAIRYNVIRGNVSEGGGGAIGNCRGIIEYNTMENNVALNGGALSQCNGLINSNRIAGNRALNGGGIHLCGGTIRKNEIVGNIALFEGGGLMRCPGLIEENIIRGNDATDGGGLIFCSGTVRANRIVENRAERGGGLYDCKAELANNVIEKNQAAREGGGLYLCNGLIHDNRIVGNIAGLAGLTLVPGLGNGGGFAACTGTLIRNNHIEGNVASFRGGGLWNCDVTLTANRIIGNFAASGGGLASCRGTLESNRIERNQAQAGGGLWNCDGLIRNNLLQANRAARGAGMHRCRGTIVNNTLAFNLGPGVDDGPSVPSLGAAMAFADPGSIVLNNIFYRNEGPTLLIEPYVRSERRGGFTPVPTSATSSPATPATPAATAGQIDASLEFLIVENNLFHEPGQPLLVRADGAATFTTVQQFDSALALFDGNMQADPLPVAAAGADGEPLATGDNDLRPAADSPAIDAGRPLVMSRLPVWDLDGLQRFVNLRVDLGCYEYGASADTDGDGLGDDEEAALGTVATLLDSDGDGAGDAMERLRGTDPSVANAPTGLTVAPGGDGIQLAVMQAFHGETLRIRPGTYRESLNIPGKTLRLLGDDPKNAGVVDATIIDAGACGPAIQWQGNEGPGASIEGLTLRHGRAEVGAAVRGNNAAVALLDCRITSNTSGGAGVVSDLVGTIAGNRIDDNLTTSGGALARCKGPITGNEFRGNRADADGGAIYMCAGPIVGNRFERNRAGKEGGAIYRATDRVADNVFIDNVADIGGAIGRATMEVRNNDFTSNRARIGGAINGNSGAVVDNRLIGNAADNGGAISSATGEIRGNRFSGNSGRFGGGALLNCSGAIEENLFENNTGISGGAIVLSSGAIRRNTFVDNVVGGEGGALAVCSGEIAGNQFLRNRARIGGALFDCDGPVRDNTIVENFALADGGGLTGCDGRIEGNLIEANRAVDGGGIWNARGAIVNNRIQGNVASFRGGGIGRGDGAIFGNLIQANGARFGGATFLGTGAARNNTIVGNYATEGGIGGGLYNYAGHVENNIFLANPRYAIYVSEPSGRPRIVRNNNFFQNWDGHYVHLQWTVYGTVAQMDAELEEAEGNFELDPRCVLPGGPDWVVATYADNDLRLKPDSPMIGIGLPVEMPAATDLQGVPRVNDAGDDPSPRLDLGAYEYFGVAVLRPREETRISGGALFEVDWIANVPWAGSAVTFELWRNGQRAFPMGDAWNPAGRGTVTLRMPTGPEGRTYQLRCISLWDPTIWSVSPGALIIGGNDEPIGPDGLNRNAVGDGWRAYR